MTDKMLKFVKIGQQTPPKREVDKRKQDFNEIYDEYINEKAKEQADEDETEEEAVDRIRGEISDRYDSDMQVIGQLQVQFSSQRLTSGYFVTRICCQPTKCNKFRYRISEIQNLHYYNKYNNIV